MGKLNRWVYAVVGIVVLFCGGVIYAWSVLSAPMAAEFPQWTKAQLSATFTLTIILFCLGCMIGGFFSGRIDPKWYVLAAALLFLAGFQITAGLRSLAALYIGFGVISGFGAGLVYNAVMSTITKWFPDRQGLISGLLLMGFGLSAFVIGKLYQALTPAGIGGWRNSFRVMSYLIFAVLVVCIPFFRRPDSGSLLPAAAAKGGRANPVSMETPTGQMVRRSAFWLYYLWAIALSAVGLALVSQANGSASEVGRNAAPGTIATVVGLISVFNSVGRVLSGMLYDRRGRSAAMHTVNLLFLATSVILMLGLSAHSFPMIVAGFILGGLSYGGVPPTNSAFISDYYGQKHFSLNFSVINTNMVFASFGSTIAGFLFDASGSYFSTYLFMAVLSAAGIAITLCIDRCDRRALAQRTAAD